MYKNLEWISIGQCSFNWYFKTFIATGSKTAKKVEKQKDNQNQEDDKVEKINGIHVELKNKFKDGAEF
jgi:hypothetical protein